MDEKQPDYPRIVVAPTPQGLVIQTQYSPWKMETVILDPDTADKASLAWAQMRAEQRRTAETVEHVKRTMHKQDMALIKGGKSGLHA